MHRHRQIAGLMMVMAAMLSTGGAASGGPDGRDLAHMQVLIRQAESLAAIPQVRRAAASQDLVFVTQTAATAHQALADHQYARAWSLLTGTRFWILTHETMPGYSQAQNWLSAGPFPDGVSEAERDAIAGLAWPGGAWRVSQTVLEQGWNRIEAGINLKDNDAWLAATSVYAASNHTVGLRFQSRDALSVWLGNRRLIAGSNTVHPDFQLNLARGWNRVLIKAKRTGPVWGFVYQWTDTAGMPCSTVELDPAIVTVGDCSVRVNGPVVRTLWWQGHELMRSRLMIFTGADTITRANFDVNLSDAVASPTHTIAPMSLSARAGGLRLEWKGEVPGSGGHVALDEDVYVSSNGVACVYRYRTLRPLHPKFSTGDPTRVFDRAKASAIYDRLFYVNVESHWPGLWDISADVETQGQATHSQQVPPRESGRAGTLVSQAFEAPRRIVFHTAEGPVAVSFATERAPELFTLYVQTKALNGAPPFWFFGLTDHVTGKQDVLPAGYSNAVTATVTFGRDAIEEDEARIE